MVKSLRFIAVLAGFAAACLASAPGTAHAVFSVTLSQVGFASLTISDGDALDDNPDPDVIDFDVTYGDFEVEGITARTDTPGDATDARLSVNSFTVRNTAAGEKSLNILTTADGYTLPGADGSSMFISNSLSSTNLDASGVGRFRSFLDGFGTPVATITGPVPPSAAVDTGSFGIRGPTFTLTNRLNVTLGPSGASDSEAQFTGTTIVTAAPGRAVPEPSTLLLSLIGMSMGGGYWLKRRRATG